MKTAREFFAASGRSEQDTLRVSDLIAYDEMAGGTSATTESGGEGGGPSAHRETGPKAKGKKR